jgi:hypothetical protein
VIHFPAFFPGFLASLLRIFFFAKRLEALAERTIRAVVALPRDSIFRLFSCLPGFLIENLLLR